MDRSVRGADSVALVLRPFAVRGVVEGFYGTPWSHDARLEVMSFLAGRGMNAYAYAPKDDARHRAEWRDSYPDGDLARFRELAAHGAGLGVRFGFAISPGLDIDYESDAIARRSSGSSRRYEMPVCRGSSSSSTTFRCGPGSRRARLRSRRGCTTTLAGADLTLCPTEYVGTHPSAYLGELGAGMPLDVDVMWTGPTVCSPELHAGDARSWSNVLGDRRVIIWDNYPVNDASMTESLHLGPYQGRDPELSGVVGGILCNPMTQAYASQIALATAMDFLADPAGYDRDASWSRAIADVGGDRSAALAVLAHACADSPIAEPGTLDLARDVAALDVAVDGPDWVASVAELRACLQEARAVIDTFAPDEAAPDEASAATTADHLAAEIAPWAYAARRAADAGLAALRLIQSARPVATTTADGHGRVAVTEPEAAMHAAFVVLYVWKGVRADDKVVFGPRFAIYSPVIQLADGSPALDARAALREDANAIDALCRLSLRAYDRWRTTAAGTPARVLVDGVERPVAADGSFDGRGSALVVRQGPISSRFVAGAPLPFSDRRLV